MRFIPTSNYLTKENHKKSNSFDLGINTYMNNYAAEKLTASWVKQNGMNVKQFDKVDLLLIRAQQTAHNVLKHHTTL